MPSMALLSSDYLWLRRIRHSSFSDKSHLRDGNAILIGDYPFGLSCADHTFPFHSHTGYGTRITAFASRKSVKKRKKRDKEGQNDVALQTSESSVDDYNGHTNSPSLEEGSCTGPNFPCIDDRTTVDSIAIPSRSAVLQACIVTSGLIAALGLAIRALSHAASTGGLPVHDCTAEVSFGFETWHLELIAGLVVLISFSRYQLLKTWPSFAESSEAANTQVLTPLQISDYLIVAVLPGISEEILFRGAVLPLLGLNWGGVLLVGALFGILHLGGGRKYSFAIWATFVGFAYGCATVASSSMVVPMASHAINNLVGAVLWRYREKKVI